MKQEEIANWVFDGEKDHSFFLLTVPAKYREESALHGSFAVEAFLPESKVNWSFPAGCVSGGEMPLCFRIKVCESSLYTLAEDWEERFAALCVSVSYPLRETALKETGNVSRTSRRQVLSFPGRALLCARLCVYRL